MRCLSALFSIALVTFSFVHGRLTAAEINLQSPRYLRDHAETRGFSLGRPTHAVPTPDGKAVLFLRAKPRTPKMELYEFTVATQETRLLLTPERILQGAEEKLSAEEKALRERQRISVGGFTNFQLSKEGDRILVSLSGKLYVVHRETLAVQELNIGPGTIVDPKFSPDGKNVACVLDHDVWIVDLAENKPRRITTGGSDEISHGLAEFVAREEMSRFSGYWWSGDSTKIAYQETDQRDVEIWNVADPAKPGELPYPSRYPRPGKANAQVRLGVVPVSGGETTWINWNRERFPYLASVTWDAEGPLTISVQTRDQKELLLLEADPSTGNTKLLIKETDAAWVNIRQDVPKWLSGNRGFLWAHEEAGSDWRLEWRNRDGSLKRVIVPANSGFKSLIQVCQEPGELLFAARRNPTDWRLFRSALDGTGYTELTPEPGCYSGKMDEQATLFVSSLSSMSRMPVSRVYRRDGTLLGELPSVAEEPPFHPSVEIQTAADNPSFYTAVVRPTDFDAKRRYPVVVYVYGGPLDPWSSGIVVSSMGAWLLPQWIANQGFIVVSIDGRGTPGRGHEWERAINKSFASVPLEDQVSGLRALGRKFPEMDLNRVGIYGWSFGGYMSALAVLKEPGVFKAAVAGAPPTDWLDYDTHYTERYLGIPPAESASYESNSLLRFANKLTRPLLLIHGTGDDNVYFSHSLKLVDALFRAGQKCEILPLSGLTHMVPDPVVNEQLYSRIVRHFKQNLGDPQK